MSEDQKKESEQMQETFTTSYVAKLLGVSAQTVRRWADLGIIKASGIKQRRFTSDEVERLKTRFQTRQI